MRLESVATTPIGFVIRQYSHASTRQFTMQISVLIPTYCRPRQLAEALASLAQQDQTLIGEVLVGDDSPETFWPANRSVIERSAIASKVRYQPNDPPLGNYPNQCALGEQARCDHVLILHDDDHLCPGGLTWLAEARLAETDPRVEIWFGKDLIMGPDGKVDPARTASNALRYGKDGAACAKPVWAWCLTQSLPPNSSLMGRATYVAWMRGTRDGNAGDWGLHVRLANSGAWGRFVAQFVSRYRVHQESNTGSRHGIDIQYMYEIAQELQVPPEHRGEKQRLVREFAEVATARYLRNGERGRAWHCFASNDWRWKRRLSPRGVATLGMLMTPAPLWRWIFERRA